MALFLNPGVDPQVCLCGAENNRASAQSFDLPGLEKNYPF
jgi:hypothetical protein